MRLLEGLSETLRFSIFSLLFLLSLYFLSYNFLYHKIYSLLLSLHPRNKTLAHLPLSVGNHPRVVLHHLDHSKIGKPGTGTWGRKKGDPINLFRPRIISSWLGLTSPSSNGRRLPSPSCFVFQYSLIIV